MEKLKTVLITGASKGIGKACAIEFAKLGYNIVINYNTSEQPALELKNELEKKYKIKTLTIQCNVGVEQDVISMVKQAINTFNSIDILINNAGICYDEPFEEKTVEHFMNTIQTNLLGTFLVSKYVSKNMLNNHFGKIINISSTSGLSEFSPFSMDYNASKAGIISLTHDLAIQLQPYINVNAIAPGWIDTEMNKDLSTDFLNNEKEKTLVKYIAKPEEVAKLAIFLSSDDARYLNSEVITLDGGR